VGDSTKHKGKVEGPSPEEEPERQSQLSTKPRGLWQQLDGRSPEPENKPRGMWNWVAERAADRPTNAPEGADRAVTPTETRAIVARASAGGGAALPRATALKFSSLGIDL